VYLGIDIGTSAVKAVLMDESGVVTDQAKGSLEVSRPHELWSEQAPGDWWLATSKAVLGLPAERRRQVKGIGLSGQMHGATLLDSEDTPLRPAILWNDGRSAAQCATLEATEARSRDITGNLAMPGFTAPKLLWVREHEPRVWDKIATVLLPKDYVRLRMTGERATDLSDASGTLWVDVGARRWSSEMLSATGLDPSHMPRLYEGTEITGKLRPDIAEQWGMGAVPVAAGAGDNAAGAAGVGVIASGDALLSLGTSGVIFVANDRFRPNPGAAVHAFCHCLPERWHQMSVMLNAAVCLDWVARLTGFGNAGALIEAVDARDPRTESLLFLPYLGGERTPHNNPNAKGVFFGLTHETDAAALGLAVLEGVALAFADGLAVLRAAGTEIESISVIGGGSRSERWGRIIAAALNRPLIYRHGGDVGPALGAARLAQVATAGLSVETVCTAPAIAHVVEPNPRMVATMARKHERFRQLYKNIENNFLETQDDR
jgi:xylulokinase